MKDLLFVGSSLDDLRSMPGEVRTDFGFAIFQAQMGEGYPDTEPSKHFSPSIVERVESFLGRAYRAMYIIRFVKAVYVLHVFEMTPPKGERVSVSDILLIQQRLVEAEAHYAKTYY